MKKGQNWKILRPREGWKDLEGPRTHGGFYLAGCCKEGLWVHPPLQGPSPSSRTLSLLHSSVRGPENSYLQRAFSVLSCLRLVCTSEKLCFQTHLSKSWGMSSILYFLCSVWFLFLFLYCLQRNKNLPAFGKKRHINLAKEPQGQPPAAINLFFFVLF